MIAAIGTYTHRQNKENFMLTWRKISILMLMVLISSHALAERKLLAKPTEIILGKKGQSPIMGILAHTYYTFFMP
tara:strand:+ start:1673 stop:1897 length:225 start_codon:yes stop_codon:yes gene_type:complete